MELSNVLLIASQELRLAWRNRWFLVYTIAFTALALAMSWLSVAGVAGAGAVGLGRTAASLVHLVLLVVPLMGLTLGAGALAAERERGILAVVMSQPVSLVEVVAGKLGGLGVAVISALLVGFGAAGLTIARSGGGDQTGAFLAFLGMAALLALTSVALGILVSALAGRASVATGSALFVWLTLVVFCDLGLLGTALATRLSPGLLLAGALANPLQAFKLGSLAVLRGGLEELGPAGLYAMRTFGSGLVPLLVVILGGWFLVAAAASLLGLKRRGVLP